MIQGGIDARQKPPAYDGPLAAKEITPDKRADSVIEKWPENPACCHKRIYLNACAVHDSFPLISSQLPQMENFSINFFFVNFCFPKTQDKSEKEIIEALYKREATTRHNQVGNMFPQRMV